MAQSRDSLIARRRRLETRVEEVRAALDGTDKTGVPDGVAGALDALYDLWEYWQRRAGLAMNQADGRVRGDVDGETAAALVHARGAKTHVFEEFGRLTDTYGDTYRDYYGVWRWQDYSDSEPRFAARNGWYASHVAREEVLPPLEAALRWMSIQPELQWLRPTGTAESSADGLKSGGQRPDATPNQLGNRAMSDDADF